ncbi:MAG: hypothetical protein WCP20_10860 [Desulfuromonadales bacterium]
MSTILLIFQIGQILIKIAPELYHAFMDIMAAIHPTQESGNDTSTQAVKAAAKAILPVLDAPTAAKVQAVLTDWEKSEKWFVDNPAALAGGA